MPALPGSRNIEECCTLPEIDGFFLPVLTKIARTPQIPKVRGVSELLGTLPPGRKWHFSGLFGAFLATFSTLSRQFLQV